MIYYVKEESTEILQYINIESILFLSKLLSDAKKNYWSTELKVTKLI